MRVSATSTAIRVVDRDGARQGTDNARRYPAGPAARCNRERDRGNGSQLVQRKVGGDRNGEIAMKNFLGSPKATVEFRHGGGSVALDRGSGKGAARGGGPRHHGGEFFGPGQAPQGLLAGQAATAEVPDFSPTPRSPSMRMPKPSSARCPRKFGRARWEREVEYAKLPFEDKESARWLKRRRKCRGKCLTVQSKSSLWATAESDILLPCSPASPSGSIS